MVRKHIKIESIRIMQNTMRGDFWHMNQNYNRIYLNDDQKPVPELVFLNDHSHKMTETEEGKAKNIYTERSS
jgi:hypothetical protein